VAKAAKMGCTNGKWEMEGRLNFGRIIGLGPVAWSFNTVKFISGSMNKLVLLLTYGMVNIAMLPLGCVLIIGLCFNGTK
jgi:hypothetical protein